MEDTQEKLGAPPFSVRFEKIIARYHGADATDAAVSRRVKISAQQVANLKGGAVPGLDTLEKIAAAYPKVSPRWLVLGEGPELDAGPTDAAVRLEMVRRALEMPINGVDPMT